MGHASYIRPIGRLVSEFPHIRHVKFGSKVACDIINLTLSEVTSRPQSDEGAMVNVLERLKQTPNRMRSSDRYCTWPDAFAHSTILLATLKIVLEDQEGHST